MLLVGAIACGKYGLGITMVLIPHSVLFSPLHTITRCATSLFALCDTFGRFALCRCLTLKRKRQTIERTAWRGAGKEA